MLPDRIVVFRDGVGDGQIKTVVDFEIPQMKSCLSMFGKSRNTFSLLSLMLLLFYVFIFLGDVYKPKIGFIIVQKRISTRLFHPGPQGYENPSPGTVLDHTVTRKGW